MTNAAGPVIDPPLVLEPTKFNKQLSSEGPAMSSTSFLLMLPRQIHDDMIQQAQSEQPNECCGLLAGRCDRIAGVRTVVARLPLVNQLASPNRYLSEPRSILNAYREIDRLGLELVGVYHSHPTWRAEPSAVDLANNALGDDIAQLIISLLDAPPTIRAWRLFPNRFDEIELAILGDQEEKSSCGL